MTLEKTLILARRHLGKGMESSARVRLADAISLMERGAYDFAKRAAIDSLRYSVGIMHADYKRASA